MNLKPRNEYYKGRLVWAVTDKLEVRDYTVDFWEPKTCCIKDRHVRGGLFRFLPPYLVFLTREEAVQHAVASLQNSIHATKCTIAYWREQLQEQLGHLDAYEKELKGEQNGTR